MAIHPIEFRYGTPEMKSIWEEENKLQTPKAKRIKSPLIISTNNPHKTHSSRRASVASPCRH